MSAMKGLVHTHTVGGCALMAFTFFLSLLKSSSTSPRSLAALQLAFWPEQSTSTLLPLVSPVLFLSPLSSRS